MVDGSAVLEVLLQTTAAPGISRRIFGPGEMLHAPHLLDLDVGHVLRRYVRSGIISTGHGVEALADLADLPLNRYPHFFRLARIWQFRHNVTAYDSAYLALAEALDAPVLTRYRALASAGARVKVEVI